MNQNPSEEKIFCSNLLHIHKALRNESALFALLVAGLSSMALVYMGSTLGSPILASLLSLFAMLVVLPAGASTAGLLLMDQARGQPPRPLLKAVTSGIPAFLRTVGIALLGVVLMVVFYLFISLLLLVCKLPLIGPALYAVLFPVLVVLAGLVYFGLMAGLAMASPAIWSGATIREALEMLWRITTNRLMELLVNLFLLALVFALIEFILLSIFFIGSPIILGASAFILGVEGFSGFGFALGPGSFSGSGYTLATVFGFVLGLTFFMTAIMAMIIMGFNLIYLQITQGLPQPKAREYARDPIPRGAVAVNKPMAQSAPQARPGSSSPGVLASLLGGETNSAATPPRGTGALLMCPRCRLAAQPGDRFCGECGGSLSS